MLSTNLYQFLLHAVFSNPKHLNAATASVSAATHTTGTGLSDATSGGTNTALLDHTYTVKITTAAGTDHIQFSTDGGAYGGDAAITGSAQTLANGVTVTFAATTGHTLNDVWTIVAPAGVAIASAVALTDIVPNQVGTTAVLSIYDGNGTGGTLLYKGLTASWTVGVVAYINKLLQNNQGLYIVLSFASAPDIIIGYI